MKNSKFQGNENTADSASQGTRYAGVRMDDPFFPAGIDRSAPPAKAYEGNEPYIFISYSHKDAAAVFPFIKEIDRRSFRVWYDDGIDPGSEWADVIADKVLNCSLLIAFISPNFASSHFCLRELEFAIKHKKQVLCVYIKPTALPMGIEMQLGPIQALYAYNYASTAEFLGKLFSAKAMRNSALIVAGKTYIPDGDPPVGSPQAPISSKSEPLEPVRGKWLKPVLYLALTAIVVLTAALTDFLGLRSSISPNSHKPTNTSLYSYAQTLPSPSLPQISAHPTSIITMESKVSVTLRPSPEASNTIENSPTVFFSIKPAAEYIVASSPSDIDAASSKPHQMTMRPLAQAAQYDSPQPSLLKLLTLTPKVKPTATIASTQVMPTQSPAIQTASPTTNGTPVRVQSTLTPVPAPISGIISKEQFPAMPTTSVQSSQSDIKVTLKLDKKEVAEGDPISARWTVQDGTPPYRVDQVLWVMLDKYGDFAGQEDAVVMYEDGAWTSSYIPQGHERGSCAVYMVDAKGERMGVAETYIVINGVSNQ